MNQSLLGRPSSASGVFLVGQDCLQYFPFRDCLEWFSSWKKYLHCKGQLAIILISADQPGSTEILVLLIVQLLQHVQLTTWLCFRGFSFQLHFSWLLLAKLEVLWKGLEKFNLTQD